MTEKPVTIRQARAALASQDSDKRDAVLQELEAIGSGEITDILAWDEMGRVQVRPSDQLSDRARQVY
jgi:hypothetical protein